MKRVGQITILTLTICLAWSMLGTQVRSEESWANILKSTVGGFIAENSNRTLGGTQIWTDEFVFRAWRIQRNALTGQYRLLDGDDRRHASGTYEDCFERFEEFRMDLSLDPIVGRVVILVHGMTGHRADINGLGAFLSSNCNLTAIEFGYASTRGSLDDHAEALAKVIERLGPDVNHIDFVGYSMGNLVIRRYLHDHNDPRVKRLVMIGPPNHGAKAAADWGDNPLFLAVMGAAGHQIGAGWESTVKKLPTPKCEFGIIAGGRGNNAGYSGSLPGDDDIILSVATTRLAGANDFKLIQGVHHLLPRQQECRDCVLRFLQKGYLVAEDKREPIEVDRE